MHTWMHTALALLMITAMAACASSDGKHKKKGGGGSDGTAPTILSVTPEGDGDNFIGTGCCTNGPSEHGSTIVIVFSESMDTGSLEIGGTLDNVGAGSWSETTVADDTLTIEPTGTACSGNACYSTTGGPDTVEIDATDVAGNALETAVLTYDLDNDGDFLPDRDEASECLLDAGC